MNIIEHPRLYRLLGSMGELEQQEWADVEDEIWQMFGQTSAVLVTDMSHFTKVTLEHGIIYYLAMIKRMQDIVAMSVTKHKGQLIKFLADNSFSIFDTVDQAVACIQEINRKVIEENAKTPEIWDIEICAGIDYGKILNINNADLFGNPVNIASKLGEDTAEPWEVLISENAVAKMDNNSLSMSDQQSVSMGAQLKFRKFN